MNSASATENIEFEIRGDFIPLDALLKVLSLAHSGGAAKMMVAEGMVQVDGQVELRKTCKLRPGQQVAVGNTRIRLIAALPDPGE